MSVLQGVLGQLRLFLFGVTTLFCVMISKTTNNGSPEHLEFNFDKEKASIKGHLLKATSDHIERGGKALPRDFLRGARCTNVNTFAPLSLRPRTKRQAKPRNSASGLARVIVL